jgi:long-chain acyl-CoA synthetase
MLNESAAKRSAVPIGRIALEASLTEHLTALNVTLDPHERLAYLVVMFEPWTVDNDLVTPTFKVKRNRIEEVFAQQCENWVGVGRTGMAWRATGRSMKLTAVRTKIYGWGTPNITSRSGM